MSNANENDSEREKDVCRKGTVIYDQLRKMGASVDWDRAVFTMDPKMTRAVTEAFIRMHERGTIYRSNRLVNWSCTLRSAISDIEVDKKELPGRTLLPVPGYSDKVEFGVIVSFAYKIKDSEEEVVVSTTRLETMLGDSAIAVHPDDDRYKHLVGKMCVHPFVDRLLPIVTDSFVDMAFGTGAVKITPAHDHNDYEVGVRHNLPFITCINDDGDISAGCGKFSGMKRFEARRAVAEALMEKGLYRDKKDNPMVVPICSRSKDVIEPILKAQWYVNCNEMATKALKAVQDGELKIVPEAHVATWNRWLESIRDWCISRQLWWGHRIPAYFITVNDGGKTPIGDQCDEKYWVSAHTEDEARAKAAKKFGVKPDQIQLKWDEDVLDTLFSSGRWPFAILGWPETTADLSTFFPSTVLETGHDILFFWVAKMVFMAQELTGKLPFKDVYLHAMIRDAHGRKMSKSLGNVIDPLDVIRGVTLESLHEQLQHGNLDASEIATAKAGQTRDYPNGIPECGTDALRFALLSYTSQGRDINLNVLRVQGYRFFCNKIWNAVKFTLMQLGSDYQPPSPFKLSGSESIIDKWILSRLANTVISCEQSINEYNFTQMTTAVYNFWLYELCDVYLEAIKPVTSSTDGALAANRDAARNVLFHCVESALRLISPMMPFLSEELWQRLPKVSNAPKSIVVAEYPEPQQYPFASDSLEADVAFALTAIRCVRSLRSDYELTYKQKTDLYLGCHSAEDRSTLTAFSSIIGTLACSNNVKILDDKDSVPAGCAHVIVSSRCTIHIGLQGIIDISKEIAKLETKKGKAIEALKKIETDEGRPDYEAKASLDHRVRNQEKKEQLTKEIANLVASIDALSTSSA
ncbi:hypothetical protein WR25_09948 isoform G [Diploscapter pachys]|uniref:Valine--tRNA ligase, mitochondrial n=1 Tax=Diploscapter pachys TaxID=2018661 RepID=A0A2A2J1V1_9BILA|nr:hypothetical protein WR25_09948 isoform C [Diploscapter pachys]PAV55629.1 hypothetical protein WR25_09948 isoform E [Diploscapter pachys]PAV55631.1 hypothetical protein WR25_09948 isoform G [Diploscapter pachys]